MNTGTEGWKTRPSYEVQLLLEQVRQMSALVQVIHDLQQALDLPISPTRILHNTSLIDLARLADQLDRQARPPVAGSTSAAAEK